MIRPVSYAEILEAPNAKALLDEYAQECSIPLIGEACPQADMYSAMEATGMFQAFGVFDEERLIGFAALLIYVLPHYGRKIATVESLFLSKAHRSAQGGSALMETIESYAKEQGCVAILYNARAESQLERLLTLLKPYERTNSVFCRSLL